MNIDWSKAPEGATHWGAGRDGWAEAFYKQDADGNWLTHPAHFFGEWHGDPTVHADWPKRLSSLVERPNPKEWNGAGLPPVGMVCEVEDADGNWHECEILAHHLGDAVFSPDPDYPYGAYDGMPEGRFRPLRTPEQIAAEEREKALKEMAGIVFSACGTILADDVLPALYDAGYRKVEQP